MNLLGLKLHTRAEDVGLKPPAGQMNELGLLLAWPNLVQEWDMEVEGVYSWAPTATSQVEVLHCPDRLQNSGHRHACHRPNLTPLYHRQNSGHLCGFCCRNDGGCFCDFCCDATQVSLTHLSRLPPHLPRPLPTSHRA